MKFLCTRLCRKPEHISQNKLKLSFDDELWQYSYYQSHFKDKFLDEYGCEIVEMYDDVSHILQPKNSKSFDNLNDDCIPCVLSVQEQDYHDWINLTDYEPHDVIYQDLDLVLLGYEVFDTLFISCLSHGISPFTNDQIELLNMFSLFPNKDVAKLYLNENKLNIPEHDWRITGLFVSKNTYLSLK